MSSCVTGRTSRACWTVAIVAALLAAGCGGVLKKEYEYEEEIYPSLDGSATVYVNASVAALVALRGADLDVNPRARLDRTRVRALFTGRGVEVASVSTSRRDGRRFVHVRINAPDVRALAAVAPLAWSTYRFTRQQDVFAFGQSVGAATASQVGDVGWTGKELVAFRIHVPSRIQFHNSPEDIQRGNILRWEQPLTERLKGVALDLQVRMETESILLRTLLLFGSTILAAVLAFALIVWWMMRRGRESEMVGSRP